MDLPLDVQEAIIALPGIPPDVIIEVADWDASSRRLTVRCWPKGDVVKIDITTEPLEG